MAAYESTKKGAFKKLSEDPATKARLKELSRRADTGIETGMEEIERSQQQSKVGAQTSANLRAAAAAGATSGVRGATQASKIAGILTGGMGQMGAFESDLAARDLAAKQAASERKAQMVADISQFDIGQDKAKLEFDTGKKDFKAELRQSIITSMIANKEPITPESVNEKLAVLNIGD